MLVARYLGKQLTGAMPSSSALLSPDLHIFTNPRTLWNISFGFLWRFYCLGIMIKPLSIGDKLDLPESQRSGSEISNPLITKVVLQTTIAILR